MFRVTARTVLQLGAELISSDAVAFYELIKNAFDAGSPTVVIRVVVRVPHEAQKAAYHAIPADPPKRLGAEDRAALARCKEAVLASLDEKMPEAKAFRQEVEHAASWGALRDLVDEANFIDVEDAGSGMTGTDLSEVFLTIGTRSRQKARQARAERGEDEPAAGRPILGEKGLGRLSSMRLGWRLRVQTTTAREARWNLLDIDWRRFSHDSDALIEEVRLEPAVGAKKEDPNQSGTLLHISALAGEWTAKKLQGVAEEEFSKLTDPFVPDRQYPITLFFNGKKVPVPRFEKVLFKYAHAQGTASFTVARGEAPRLSGTIEYKLRGREKTFLVEGENLLSITGQESLDDLRALGPFTVEFSWYNRLALKAIEDNIEELGRVKELLKLWAGGLMVFRDGFRVFPYGDPDNDWLDLDKKALASGGYKVNRRQLVGKVEISSTKNPALLDQSNREGLRDCDEKRILILLLKHVLETEFRTFLNQVDAEVKSAEPTTFDNLEERVRSAEERMQEGLRTLRERHPALERETEVLGGIREAVEELERWMREARELAETYEAGRAQMIHLAGIGLMVEILAHELTRATSNTLATLAGAGSSDLGPGVASLFSTLQSQLTTLQKRLRVLDPLSTSGRQVKDTFDLAAWVGEILQAHEAQFARHNIRCTVRVEPPGARVRIRAVKGMIVQILENLVSNSVYWLDQRRKLERRFSSEIVVTVIADPAEVRFADNGPGIEVARRDEVFQPFVTTKPPGEGKGLGLYISREIARYNDADLVLSDDRTVHRDRLNTFILRVKGGAR